MTTHGIDRLRRSLDNQLSAGAMTYAMRIEDMEGLVRECEMERDRLTAYAHGLARVPLASDGKPLRIGEIVWGQDGKQFAVAGIGPEFVWGRAEGRKTHKRLRPEWLTHERPDSWERVLRDCETEREKAIANRCICLHMKED